MQVSMGTSDRAHMRHKRARSEYNEEIIKLEQPQRKQIRPSLVPRSFNLEGTFALSQDSQQEQQNPASQEAYVATGHYGSASPFSNPSDADDDCDDHDDDMSMTSSDDEFDSNLFSAHSDEASPPDTFMLANGSSVWRDPSSQNRKNRASTPLSVKLMRGAQHHVRSRHPPEIAAAPTEYARDEISPIESDEVVTPRSSMGLAMGMAGADDARSQLAMMSFSDMEVDGSPSDHLAYRAEKGKMGNDLALDGGEMKLSDGITAQRKRQRSGAQSEGSGLPPPHHSANPASSTTDHSMEMDKQMNGLKQRGLAVGFRADCEKCQLRVPGHMNHFIT